MTGPRRVDVVVVGAGFAGLYAMRRMQQLGLNTVGFEAGADVGGTWFWNTYPGARCDIESIQYSYSWDEDLQAEWDWPERYGAQADIQAYASHVADRFDLRRCFSFGTRVTSACFDERSSTWSVSTDRGDEVVARFVVAATGNLSAARIPDIEGLAEFGGTVLHTGRWPREGVDLAGRTVAVVGTGSSGVQLVPAIAPEVERLYVLQRTPAYVIPARNHPLDAEYLASVRATYSQLRERARQAPGGAAFDATDLRATEVDPDQREKVFAAAWETGGQVPFGRSFTDLFTSPEANRLAAEFVQQRLFETVEDPDTARALCPSDYPIFAKRICVDDNYWATFNRENVELVDLAATPLERIDRTGFITSGGHVEVDTIIFATGFDAFTGALARIDVVGRSGAQLSTLWAQSPRSYLGLMVAGFPNLFLLTGPGSPSVLANVIASIEQHVDWIARLLTGTGTEVVIEADRDAETAWMQHVADLAARTIFVRGKSWYTGENVPGKPVAFLPYVGGLHVFRQLCDEIADDGYRGFHLEAVGTHERGVAR